MVIIKEKANVLKEGRIKINVDSLREVFKTIRKNKSWFFDWTATDQAYGYKQGTTAQYTVDNADDVGVTLSKDSRNLLTMVYSNIVEVYLDENCIDIIFKNKTLLSIGFNPNTNLHSFILQIIKRG